MSKVKGSTGKFLVLCISDPRHAEGRRQTAFCQRELGTQTPAIWVVNALSSSLPVSFFFCACVHTRMSLCTCVFMSVYVPMCVLVFVCYACVSMSMCVCCMFLCVFLCFMCIMPTCVHVCLCVLYVPMCVLCLCVLCTCVYVCVCYMFLCVSLCLCVLCMCVTLSISIYHYKFSKDNLGLARWLTN